MIKISIFMTRIAAAAAAATTTTVLTMTTVLIRDDSNLSYLLHFSSKNRFG